MMYDEAKTPDVTLGGSARQVDGELAVEMVLENRGASTVLFLAHPESASGVESPEDPAAYRWLSGDRSRLVVSLLPPTPPANIDPDVAVLPISRRLGPNERYGFVFRFAIPVREWNPYVARMDRGAETVEVSEVELETGWFPEVGTIWREEGPESGTWRCQGAPFRTMSTVISIPEPIRVLDEGGRIPRP